MLPIAVLPAAGLLLRLGQPDMLNIAFIASAGDAIFSNLGLLFAIGIAVGLARENHGAAGLAGAVGFLVATRGAQVLIAVPPAALAGIPATAQALAADAFKAAAIAKLSVPAGIASGLIAGWLYNKYRDIKLPEFLAFFGGRRFIPIASRCGRRCARGADRFRLRDHQQRDGWPQPRHPRRRRYRAFRLWRAQPASHRHRPCTISSTTSPGSSSATITAPPAT